jgi:DNA-nicking Smr family endonuclease
VQFRLTIPAKRKTLTDTDRGEWAAYARLVAPLPGRAVPDAPASVPPAIVPPDPAAETPRRPAPPPMSRPAAVQLSVGDNPGGLDKSSWNRLRTGRLAPSRTLDLHGRTAQRAYHALVAFLHAAHADQVRCVEVITGRGSGETGVIRREFPLWLNQPALRPLVLAASHPHPANPGAVRLLLRRQR